MKCKLLLKHQCKSSHVLFVNLMNTWWRSALQFQLLGKCLEIKQKQFKPNNNASYGNTYNSSWRNHPNFSWKPRAPQYQQPAQPSQQASSLEQAIVNLSKCKRRVDFLLNLTKTPRVSMKWKLMRRIFTVRDVKALITLRSGKKVELPTPKPHVEEEEEEETEKRRKSKERRKISVKGKRTMIQQ
ncbi:hypothetical protein CK203_108799 [Vitis vinifera]|uniref:Uncharacterized protein n=1 Tax=Vitis vinifera TaxID=29760 RepID=A0A438BPA7_VITVI|nr:hypothetical protein CK203_108799 [Vitis vinifera]